MRPLTCVAKLTGGRFFDASNAKALTRAIQESLAVPYEVQDFAGEVVARGTTGQAAASVPEGVYTIVVRAAGTPITVRDVRVAPVASLRSC
ncbi:MAG TPA: hypothetical protein VJA65_04340 [bacterium]|nr:hypothetical protein [bacterium]